MMEQAPGCYKTIQRQVPACEKSKKLLKRTRIRGIASQKRSRSPDGSLCGFQVEKLTNRKRWKERGGEEERDAEGGGRAVQQIPRAFPFVLFARHKRNI